MHLLVIHSNDWLTNMLIRWFTMRYEHKITRWKTEDPELSFDNFDGVIVDFDIETLTAATNVVRQIRARFPNLPIILFSDLDRNGDPVKHAFAIGATTYLKKSLPVIEARDRALEFIRGR